jgi:hypothetical protein
MCVCVCMCQAQPRDHDARETGSGLWVADDSSRRASAIDDNDDEDDENDEESDDGNARKKRGRRRPTGQLSSSLGRSLDGDRRLAEDDEGEASSEERRRVCVMAVASTCVTAMAIIAMMNVIAVAATGSDCSFTLPTGAVVSLGALSTLPVSECARVRVWRGHLTEQH